MKKNLFTVVFTFLISTSVLISCGNKTEEKAEEKESETAKTWPKAFQDLYLKSCTQNASASMTQEVVNEYCACTLGKIMAKYPDPTAMQSVGQEEILSLSMECMTAEMVSGAAK